MSNCHGKGGYNKEMWSDIIQRYFPWSNKTHVFIEFLVTKMRMEVSLREKMWKYFFSLSISLNDKSIADVLSADI